MTVSFVIKARDHMFPGRPDIYYYGYGPSQRTPGKVVPLFGREKKEAFTIEASTEWCAWLVANAIASGLNGTPSIKPWAVRIA